MHFPKRYKPPKNQGETDAKSRFDFLKQLKDIEHFPILFENTDRLISELEDAIDKLLQDEVFVKDLKVE